MRNILLGAAFSLLIGTAFGQTEISGLFVHEMKQNDTIIDFVLIEFACSNAQQLAKVEIKFEDAQMQKMDLQQLEVIQKSGKQYIKLLNDEEIEVKEGWFAFVTPIKDPEAGPFETITVRGILKQGIATGPLTYSRQSDY